MQKKKESGVITLEACVSVFIFLFLMLLLSGLFKMFMAQNMTAHVLLESTQSLALDEYSAKKLGHGDGFGSVGDLINTIFGWTNNDNFTSYEKCYTTGKDAQVNVEAVKRRFIGYLAGGEDAKKAEAAADAFLKKVKVVNGVKGLDFKESYVENGTLHIVLKYELEQEINIWDVTNVKVRQTACSKLW